MIKTTPGCFGSVMSYDSSDAICIACEHKVDCEEKSYATLSVLREKIATPAISKVRDKERVNAGQPVSSEEPSERKAARPRGDHKLTREHLNIVKSITAVKPAKCALNLFKRGIDGLYIQRALRVGHNPFVKEPPHYLSVACRMLMNGGFTRRELSSALQQDKATAMKEKTAASHVSIAVALLPAIGVAYETDGRFILKED